MNGLASYALRSKPPELPKSPIVELFGLSFCTLLISRKGRQ